MKKQIYIIGAGAIGKALAVFLQLAGKKVTLLRGSVDDGTECLEKIQVVLDNEVLETDITVTTLSNFPVLDGLIILTNKSFGNESLALALKSRVKHSPLVLLQNGLGIEQAFIDRAFPEIYRCVLLVTSQVMKNGQVRFKAVSTCPVGIIKGNEMQLRSIIEDLNNSYFGFTLEPDIQPAIWKKAIVNSIFNSVCALLDTDNGIFYREVAALEIAQRIIAECLLIAQKKGIILSAAEVTESVLRVSRFSTGQLISTLQDIKLGRKTEIDTLNFAIVAIAKSLGHEHLVPETKLLGELTRLKAGLNSAIKTP